MSKLLYTPILIPTPEVDSDLINSEFNKKCSMHFTKLWNFWTIRFKPYDSDIERWENRYSNDNIQPIWDNDFKVKFPECVNFLDKLPFEEITHINLLKQLKDIPLHYDYHANENVKQNNLCYKWMIVLGKKNSFFIESKNKSTFFVNPKVDFSCFCIQESYVKHGAIKRDDEKIVMSIFGKPNIDQHNNLIKLSTEKFYDTYISE